MSKRLIVSTEIRVLEEDETMCSLDCQHHELEGTAHWCVLFDCWLERYAVGKTMAARRCNDCRNEAK